MEIDQYLQVLLRDDSSSGLEASQSYFDVVASKTHNFMLSFDGVKILPPLLSEADRQEMREYRRKAASLEQKHFVARRENFSNLLLQVMQVMDKVQEGNIPKKDKMAGPKQDHEKTYQSMRMEGSPIEALTISESRTSCTIDNSDEKEDQPLKIPSQNNNPAQDKTRSTEQQTLKDNDHSLVPIFQKPKLYNSSLSPGRNKSGSNASLHSDLPSAAGTSQSVGSVRSSTLGRDSIMSSVSTIKGSDQSLVREALESRQDLDPSDSLASTVLSMAFTESSYASQQSTIIGSHQSTKSAQRQLNMDHANHNLYQSYYQKVNPLTSTPTDLQQEKVIPRQKSTTKKTTSPASYRIGALKVSTKTDTQQEKALEKLELMKRKLLEEKEKQMVLLKQQELARLRRSKEQSVHLVSKEHHEEVNQKVLSPGYVALSRPGSDMYSIPERSFEGMESFAQGDQSEVESTSDKENNAYPSNLHQNTHQLHDDNNLISDNQPVDYEAEERFSSEVDLRPISVQPRQNTRREHRRSSLYIRREFENQFEIEMSKEDDGKGVFSILTAYAKGFLTRRVLQTEKVQAIVKTIKDTSEFLADISKEGATSYQDKTLEQRVQTQLAAAKSKLYDIFFTISTRERMMYVEHSRIAARERQDRMSMKTTTTKSSQAPRKLSAATMKAMQRRQVETNNNLDAKQPPIGSQLGKRRSIDTRALKPVQSSKSPQVQERRRSQVKRRSLASPLARRSVGKKNLTSRPATAIGTKSTNKKSVTRSSKEETTDKPTKSSRAIIDGKSQTSQIAKRTKSDTTNTEKNLSKLPVKKRESLGGGLTYRVPREDLEKTRPSTAMTGSNQSVPGQMAIKNKPKTGAERRVTRSMAANFKNL